MLFASGWRKGESPKQEDEETYSFGKKEIRLVLDPGDRDPLCHYPSLHPLYSLPRWFSGSAHSLYGQRNKLKIILPSVLPAYHHIHVGFTYGLQLHMP